MVGRRALLSFEEMAPFQVSNHWVSRKNFHVILESIRKSSKIFLLTQPMIKLTFYELTNKPLEHTPPVISEDSLHNHLGICSEGLLVRSWKPDFKLLGDSMEFQGLFFDFMVPMDPNGWSPHSIVTASPHPSAASCGRPCFWFQHFPTAEVSGNSTHSASSMAEVMMNFGKAFLKKHGWVNLITDGSPSN